MPEVEIGKITHYFGHIQVAAIELSGTLRVGDTIRIVGHTTNCEEKVETMQVEHQDVAEAKAGDSIGIKIKGHVRPHDRVFKIVQERGVPGL
ncbi:MAG: EF-Tu/IF-2/RF-3 family GTPase [Candidatus Aureabacteria bacterium]|nr:EF-Tu/IF-2/RF-3 family GTPase [Candidatus Auribacterota bacterium]